MRYFILLFISVLAPALSAAPCEISKGGDPANAYRVRIVKFADGREVTIVGHNHGDRELPFQLYDLIKADDLANPEFSARLETLAARVEIASRQAAGDAEYFRDYLSRAKGRPFVGFESTEEIAHGNFENYALLRDGFKKALAKRGLAGGPAADGVIRVSLGPAFYLLLDQPQLAENLEVRGFESKEAIRAYDQASERAERALARLKELAFNDQKFLGGISGTDFQLWMLYDAFDPALDPPKILASIRLGEIPAAYRAATLDWMRARLDEMSTLKAREAAVADGMIGAGRSGILFMGEKHLEGVAAALARRCALTPQY
jgi:hypothetical protein